MADRKWLGIVLAGPFIFRADAEWALHLRRTDDRQECRIVERKNWSGQIRFWIEK